MSSTSEDDSEKQTTKTLIVCIDRDNDLGLRTGIKTPVVGKDACMNAAEKLALADPEEADANAIYAAVKEYDELLSKGFDCEVVVVSGLFEGGVLGDNKIRQEIAQTLKGFPATGVVLVSDGVEGEELAPVIQSLVPIISLRRVVVKHSRTVEESYEVLGRYLKMLIFDPRYARYALGIPGLIFVAVVLVYFAAKALAVPIFVLLIGIIFVVRGFDIDRKIESLGSLSTSGYLKLFGVIASILLVLGGIAAGASSFFVNSKPPCIVNPVNASAPSSCSLASLIAQNPSVTLKYVPNIIGYFVLGSQRYVWLGIGVYITTAIFFDLLRPRPRNMMRNGVALAVLGLLYYPVLLFADVLVSGGQAQILTATVLFALAVNFTIAAYVYRYLSKKRRPIRSIGAIEESSQ